MSAGCPLCRSRKGKRACPAKGASICAPCCGSKRQVEIDCPSDCVYLSGAHAAAWAGRETELRRDTRRFAQHLQPLDDRQAQLFLLALVRLAKLRARRAELDDALLGSALGAWRRTLETRDKGLIYEHTPDDARAAAVLADLRELFEAQAADGERVAPTERDLLAVVAALDNALREARATQEGPLAFLESVERLAQRMGVEPRAARRGPLIVEP